LQTLPATAEYKKVAAKIGSGPFSSGMDNEYSIYLENREDTRRERKDECTAQMSLNNCHRWRVCHKFDSIYRKYVQHLYH